MRPVVIDGSFGEGGGQILRSSLALATVLGVPVRIENVRAGRAKPGLARQHLTAVRAAAAISSAEVTGDEIGSTRVELRPGEVRPGDYRFDIGTAGSTTLVLQTVLPPLLLASSRSTLVLEGGTHNPGAPTFDFVSRAFLPLVNRMGPTVSVDLERIGFFPRGGGRLRVTVEPTAALHGFDLRERGRTVRRRARALVANLPRHIAEREVAVLQRRLGWPRDSFVVEETSASRGPGNVVVVELESEHVCEVVTALGALRRPAEAVAAAAVRGVKRYRAGTAPVGEFLADQLLLPLALAGSGSFRAVGLSRHAETHIELIRQFLDGNVGVEDAGDDGVIVTLG